MANIASARTWNSTAVYGDMNTQQATIAPNMQQLNGPQLKTIVDTEVFNLQQTLTLNNTVYDTRNSWFNVQSFTTNAATIQGSLDGWTTTQSMFLMVPGNITFQLGTGTPITSLQNFYDGWDGGELAFMNMFDTVRTYMGKNNIRIGRPSGEICNILKTSFLDNQYNDIEADVIGQVGLPYSNCGYYGGDNATTRTNNFLPVQETTQATWINRWNKVIMDIACIAQLQSSSSTLMEVALPISTLSSYFKVKQWLPPNLPLKLEMSFKQGAILLGSVNFGNIASGAFPSSALVYFTPALNQIKLFYRSHLLNADVQQSINNEWITKKFLTNYYTYEYQEYVGNGSQVITMNITISQQRPLMLILKVIPTNTPSTANGAYNVYSDSISPLHNYQYVNINIGGRNKVEYYNLYATPTPQIGMRKAQNAMNAYINAYQYKSKLEEGAYTWGYGTNMENFKTNYTLGSTTRNPIFGTDTNSGFTYGTGQPLCFVVNPGDMVDTNTMATDQGATSITIETQILEYTVNFTGDNITAGPMSSAYKLVVVKKYPEQLTLGQDLNVGLVQWPAVVTSPNNIYISNTFNNN